MNITVPLPRVDEAVASLSHWVNDHLPRGVKKKPCDCSLGKTHATRCFGDISNLMDGYKGEPLLVASTTRTHQLGYLESCDGAYVDAFVQDLAEMYVVHADEFCFRTVSDTQRAEIWAVPVTPRP